ncbi:sugar transferase [Puniceibacterium sediminis]|uniref:Sugar transferase involved in LPS biosynthesis (Colanic, teichoic acid) n=1 Tax=Puniceibacterium sediminis TaxID=1608407 RepID=A0A238VWK4_9RHOB|nr:sugar transferase [Puniceibacterium sediminis]SNR38517.1 Sugar transferase involved in LPS biosynthesis (colanic, teichoic acid) [Puniceibacterium sediminis]
MTLHLRQAAHNPIFEELIDKAFQAAPRKNVYGDFFKRILDICIVAIAAAPVVLLLAVLSALILMDGKSPVYLQKRVGRNGRTFMMWKLRTMVVNADSLLEAHLAANPAARAEWDRTQKLRNDPRITFVGRLLRKTSLDELPQLWNVAIGDMSLVGPRPMLPEQRAMYPGTAYYDLRPGITGLWQTSVRNTSSFAERARFDTAYLRRVSLQTDLLVLLRTVKVVVTGTGC